MFTELSQRTFWRGKNHYVEQGCMIGFLGIRMSLRTLENVITNHFLVVIANWKWSVIAFFSYSKHRGLMWGSQQLLKCAAAISKKTPLLEEILGITLLLLASLFFKRKLLRCLRTTASSITEKSPTNLDQNTWAMIHLSLYDYFQEPNEKLSLINEVWIKTDGFWRIINASESQSPKAIYLRLVENERYKSQRRSALCQAWM